MKPIRALSLTLLIVAYGMPLPVLAQGTPEVFSLPMSIAGEPYRANIQSVLRDNYGLKLETDERAPVFRWAIVGGGLPLGLMLRANGMLIGVPRTQRDESYRFQLKVIDVASPGTGPLTLDFSLMIAAARIRLSRISAPRIVPIGSTVSEKTPRNDIQASLAASETVYPIQNDSKPISNTASFAFREKPVNADTIYASMLSPSKTSEPSITNVDMRAGQSDSTAASGAKYRNGLGELSPNLPSIVPRNPAPVPAPKPTVDIDPNKVQMSGEKVRGPVTIQLQNLNILRYDIKVGKDVTFTAGPDLKLPFIPPIPAQPEKANAGGTGAVVAAAAAPATCATVQVCFGALIDRLNGIESIKAANVNGSIAQITADVNQAKADVESLVSASDSVLTTGGGVPALLAGLTPLIGAAGGTGSVDTALSGSWPDTDIESLLGKLNVLKNDLLTLPTVPIASGPTFDTWYNQNPGNKATYDAARARIDELQSQLNGLKSSSTQGTAFNTAQNKLRVWRPILIGVRDGGAAGFSQTVKVGCGFAFDTTKETKVKVVKRDRLADPGTAPTTEEIVTVVCSSPLTVSGGFGFSKIEEREFVFVPSTKTVTTNGQATQTVISRFGFKNKSGFRTLPVLLLNTRIWEPNDTIALHLSTGAAVDIKTGQGGTDLEYIVGPSLSVWRTLFVTPGLHIGRVPKLAGGFSLDQEVPTGISEPPLEKTWKKGFVVTFTYKIR